MSKPKSTKLLIAETVKLLASHKSLDKISVGEIAEKAGINRKTFYYHFKDKQEVICWIFDCDMEKIVDKQNNNTILDDIAEYMYSEKNFYISALSSDAQNNLKEHLHYVTYETYRKQISQIKGDKYLSDSHIQIFSNLFSFGTVGMLSDWATSGMKKDAVDFIAEYGTLLTESLEILIDSFVIKTPHNKNKRMTF